MHGLSISDLLNNMSDISQIIYRSFTYSCSVQEYGTGAPLIQSHQKIIDYKTGRDVLNFYEKYAFLHRIGLTGYVIARRVKRNQGIGQQGTFPACKVGFPRVNSISSVRKPSGLQIVLRKVYANSIQKTEISK